MIDTFFSRAPMGWLRERDIDLLLCAELHAMGAFEGFFASRVLAGSGNFVGAWVSVGEVEGETDVMASWSRPGGRVLVLIENKIAAPFQPDQGLRYHARAERWASETGFAAAVTVLFAPEKKFLDPEAELFDFHITFEEVCAFAQSQSEARLSFFADGLEEAVTVQRTGYVAVPVENVSATWRAIWTIASAEFQQLRMTRPGDKPGRSTWVYLRNAEGLPQIAGRSLSIVYKAERGQADLMFGSTDPQELGSIELCLDADMKLEQAAKSSSVRIAVPSIQFGDASSAQLVEIRQGLSACERLRLFALDNAKKLETIGSKDV